MELQCQYAAAERECLVRAGFAAGQSNRARRQIERIAVPMENVGAFWKNLAERMLRCSPETVGPETSQFRDACS